MGYRVFRDSQGTEWQTWDVVPLATERRVGDRRREGYAPPAPGGERRRMPDRRVLAGRRPSVLSAGLNAGWLCFEAPREKRRLVPIPDDWQRCPQDRLEQYCRMAKPAMRVASAADIAMLVDRNAN
jgi:hypothetical protein